MPLLNRKWTKSSDETFTQDGTKNCVVIYYRRTNLFPIFYTDKLKVHVCKYFDIFYILYLCTYQHKDTEETQVVENEVA